MKHVEAITRDNVEENKEIEDILINKRTVFYLFLISDQVQR